ncbi:MAG: cytochrome c [Sediminibacterium sp.]|nr:cytochrome c [Sediminibacterium sp.]
MIKNKLLFVFVIEILIFLFSNNCSAQNAEQGKMIFSNYCQSCHQANGKGVPNMNPSLVKAPLIINNNPSKLIDYILKGSQGQKQAVDGEYFPNDMPAQKDLLNDQQLADVIFYIQKQFNSTYNLKKIMPEMIQKRRKLIH